MQRFKVVESYLHRAAKSVVLDWLRAAAKEANEGADWFALPPVKCRPNRSGPAFGIWPEWTIAGDYGSNIVWDECWPLDDDSDTCGAPPPTPEDIIAAGMKPQCVVDIGVMHKGRLGCAVEIVHKHPVPEWKRALLETLDVEVIEVCATGVLSQIGRPARLPLWRPRRRG